MNIRWFKDLTIKDIPSVGGKNASLGEMYSKLVKHGINIPNGFALTADVYWVFMKENKLDKKIKETIKGLDVKNVRALSAAGEKVRKMILAAEFPANIKIEIEKNYDELCKLCGRKELAVAVRSSATAEDLPDASFAGQQETYLNIRGKKELLLACKKCISSLFTDRAISYREAKGFDHMTVALSVCVQEMVRSDIGASGVMFTLDTESGFDGVVLINAAYGLGEYVVKGRVVPDQYYIFKAGVKKGKQAIISRRLGSKEVRLGYMPKGSGTKQEKVSMRDQKVYCLKDKEVMLLAKWGMQIEEHYGHAMDIEWARDGETGKMFIVQARGETVKSQHKSNILETYKLARRGKVLATGAAVGQKIGAGKVRIIENPKQMKSFKAGEVLVTRITDPDWEPIMRIAAAIVTEQGGKTSHAAIVSRELGIPCIVGAKNARKLTHTGEAVTVSCSEGEIGYVYQGALPFEVQKDEIKDIMSTHTKIMMNVGDPNSAFGLANIPSNGVGLAREEFIFTNFIKIHPMALVRYKELKDRDLKKKIDDLTVGYENKGQYCVDKLAEGMAFIASAFYPNDVIVRLSDFKTNEYATLIGGKGFEPKEENPMIGWRGASRYYDPAYKPAFKLECEAIKKVRDEWGLNNVIVMVPFCRTVSEGKKVLDTMAEFGLKRGENGLQVYVMCEIPSNVILAKEYSEIFDGFSIGSNDLTQLTLGVDRDSALVSHVYDEKNAAVKTLIRQVIKTAHEYKRKVGICGQAPSDYPEFAEFLVQEGIDSISLNPDTVLKTRIRIGEMEKKIGKKSNKKNNFALASKMFILLGIFGLAVTLTGYTCNGFNNQAMVDQIKVNAINDLAAMEQRVRASYDQRLADLKTEHASETTEYAESSFANFKIKYPAGWTVAHSDTGVKFASASGTEWFAVQWQKTGRPLGFETVTSTEFLGYKGERFSDSNIDDKNMRIEVLELTPSAPPKDKKIFEFSGDLKNFENMLKGVTGLQI